MLGVTDEAAAKGHVQDVLIYLSRPLRLAQRFGALKNLIGTKRHVGPHGNPAVNGETRRFPGAVVPNIAASILTRKPKRPQEEDPARLMANSQRHRDSKAGHVSQELGETR